MSKGNKLWQNGWLTSKQKIISPNFNQRPKNTKVNLIVIHSISLPPGKYSGNFVADFFCNQLDWQAHPYFNSIKDLQVSSHFFIRRNGKVIQFVSCDERAWHAGNSHYLGQLSCNDFSIGIELEGLENYAFTKKQYQSITSLCKNIITNYPIEYVAGHEHIAPGRKQDPGVQFNWLLLQQQLQWHKNMFPNTIKF